MILKLTLFPNGNAIITCPFDLTPAEADDIRVAWDRWKATPQGLIIMPSTEVEHATSVEIDLPVERVPA